MIDSRYPGDEPDDETPSWFTNEPEPEPEEPSGTFWRTTVGVGAILVILILLLIPVLQAEILQRRREQLPDSTFDRTALLFSSAILFGRSEGQAMLFATDDSRDQIREVLRIIVDRPEPSPLARLQIRSSPCSDKEADACYVGRIFDPDNPLLAGIRFGLEESGGTALVIWVELDATRI